MAMVSSSHILQPARASTIAISLAAALLVNLLPWPDLRLVPDFVALVLAFWCVRQPRLVGLGVAWSMGLLSDAANGVLLGQHALAYSLLQALHIAVILVVTQGAVVLVRLAAGAQFPGWALLVGPLAGACLWPAVSWLLLLPQRRLEREQMI
jgi:rod shape-determining protein MreD